MWVTASPRAKRIVLACWAVFACANLWAMWAFPGAETIPFHFVWISIAVVFGVNAWPTPAMMLVLAVVTVTTGWILWHHADIGEIGLEETAEVPLMAIVFLVMVWHVRGRQRAVAELERVAARDWSAQSTAGVVETNEDHLRAALDGLVENAIAFTQNGDGISVHARRSPDSLTIEVSDTGAGIAPDHLDHIFERSWTSRGRPANGRSGGTGLGLAIVRTAVETLGGTIRVRSVVGGGTT